MSALSRFIRLETHYSAPVEAGGATITPVSRALVVDLGPVGFVWNRPSAVLVERGDSSRRVSIPDPTGLALAAIAVVVVAMSAYSVFRRR